MTGPGGHPDFDGALFDGRPQLRPKFDVLSPPECQYTHIHTTYDSVAPVRSTHALITQVRWLVRWLVMKYSVRCTVLTCSNAGMLHTRVGPANSIARMIARSRAATGPAKGECLDRA